MLDEVAYPVNKGTDPGGTIHFKILNFRKEIRKFFFAFRTAKSKSLLRKDLPPISFTECSQTQNLLPKNCCLLMHSTLPDFQQIQKEKHLVEKLEVRSTKLIEKEKKDKDKKMDNHSKAQSLLQSERKQNTKLNSNGGCSINSKESALNEQNLDQSTTFYGSTVVSFVKKPENFVPTPVTQISLNKTAATKITLPKCKRVCSKDSDVDVSVICSNYCQLVRTK